MILAGKCVIGDQNWPEHCCSYLRLFSKGLSRPCRLLQAITISLQTSTPTKGVNSDKVNKNNGSDQDTYETGFDAALTDAQSKQSPDTGKDLPREEFARDHSPGMGDAVQLGSNSFQIQKSAN